MLTELNAFDKNYIKLISSFLCNRKYSTKINSSFSNWENFLTGAPQGSILGPLLFNIYMRDLFLLMTESNIAHYTDDTTLYTRQKNNLFDEQRKLEF